MKKEKILKNSNVVIYQTKSGAIELKGDFSRDMIWATQAQIGQIFNIDRTVATKHINSILKDREVDGKSNVQKMHIANSDKPIFFYSLDMILVELFTGQYKETGNPDKTLTTGEKDLIVRDLKIIHNNFIKAVSENRNISFEKVSVLADGSSMMGEQAKKSGLIDRIGDRIDVEAYLDEKIGEKAEICWY